MANFLTKLIKYFFFILIGVPILAVCWYFILSSPSTLEQSTSSDGASKEEQIAALEEKIKKEKLSKEDRWQNILRKALKEGNLARDKVLNSDFIYLNDIHKTPLDMATKSEKQLLNKKLEGEIVKFDGYIRGKRDNEVRYRVDKYEKTGIMPITDKFWIWKFKHDEAVYCTFRNFDNKSIQNYLRLASDKDNRFEKFTLKVEFDSISYSVLSSGIVYGDTKHRINLKNCVVM